MLGICCAYGPGCERSEEERDDFWNELTRGVFWLDSFIFVLGFIFKKFKFQIFWVSAKTLVYFLVFSLPISCSMFWLYRSARYMNDYFDYQRKIYYKSFLLLQSICLNYLQRIVPTIGLSY